MIASQHSRYPLLYFSGGVAEAIPNAFPLAVLIQGALDLVRGWASPQTKSDGNEMGLFMISLLRKLNSSCNPIIKSK